MSERKLSRYIKHGNYLVKGWLLPGAIEATALLAAEQEKAKVTGGVAEIGVHHGKLFILLYLLVSSGEPAIAIDLFSRQELNSDHSGAGDMDRFMRNLIRHADTRRLVIHEGDSMQLTGERVLDLCSAGVRLFSIDGGHSAEVTSHDLQVSEAALATGGIVILDDCFNQAWPGVVEGVSRFFSVPRSIVPFGIGANKTFFCETSFVERYSAVLRQLDPQAVTHTFMGAPVVCFDFHPRTVKAWIERVDAFRLVRRIFHDALSRL